MKKILLPILACLVLGLPSSLRDVRAESARVITVMSHDSLNISKEVVAEFEKTNHVTIRFLKAGDAGAALNKAILSKRNPLADIFFGVDNTFLSRALDADIFIPYASPLLAEVHDELKIDPSNRMLPVDFGDVCLNYDKKWFAKKGISPPKTLEDLTKPAYKGLTVVENPATSSPGLAFLLATIGKFGQEGYLEYWKKLKDNDVLVTNGWEEAYWGQFSAASDGDRPIVVSYATSPPAEVYFSKEPLKEAPTAAILSPGSSFRQIEFVGILKGTKKLDLAKKLIDFMLDRKFQEDMPLQMFVFPVNKSAILPEVFRKHSKVANYMNRVTLDQISANREKWINEWRKLVLR
ncbi:MAG: thiamine ABC transporter substrate-binding protein [Deltaproteobacteria bacterium]|nr:thiamine ABC transporter substrate-binding protein [Deltaproteobacteria bacterium]MBW2052772.1 thiamine ABC transporter substrate-binding protein [Deltaproteobacteria bacterium]